MDFVTADMSTTLIGLFLGIGLAAASGFRVFLPLFVLSLAIHFNLGDYLGMNTLSEDFLWLGSWAALITLGVATIVEILAYYIPFIDNLLDTLAVPLAAIAGTLLVASQLVDMPEALTWSLAIITGGGTAATIGLSTTAVRATSSGTTAGTGNFIVSTIETVSAVVMSFLSFILPLIAFIAAVCMLIGGFFFYKYIRRR